MTMGEYIDKLKNGPNVDCNKYLYHYTKLETGFEYILDTGMLRMSQLSKVNDPKESKERRLGVSHSVNDSLPEGGLNSINNEANNIFLNKCRLMCFSCDNKKVLKAEFYEKLFFRGHCRPRMWAQYADNHRGFCFVFDKKMLEQQIKFSIGKHDVLFKGKVKYCNYDVKYYHNALHLEYRYFKECGLEKYLYDVYFKRFKNELFFTKALDWRDEYEYRWVLACKEEKEVYIPIGESLKYICVGANFPKVYEMLLAQLNLKYKSKLQRIYWNNGLPVIQLFK